MKVVAVSGGFDPIHPGHIDLFRQAKEYGNHLLVILNNDNWLMKKKGYVFMPQNYRRKILESIRYVDLVVYSYHSEDDTDLSVRRELIILHPQIFCNGKSYDVNNCPETEVCRELGIEMIFGLTSSTTIGISSTDLLKQVSGFII